MVAPALGITERAERTLLRVLSRDSRLSQGGVRLSRWTIVITYISGERFETMRTDSAVRLQQHRNISFLMYTTWS